jgi:CheY-like chemotaxis protein
MSHPEANATKTKSPRPFRARVLLVEDHSLIGLDLAITLQSLGYDVAGPCRTAQEGLIAVERLHPDVAVLDIDLGDGNDSFALARELERHDIPFVFVTGFSEKVRPAPEDLQHRPRLKKPVEFAQLLEVVEEMIDAEPEGEDVEAE